MRLAQSLHEKAVTLSKEWLGIEGRLLEVLIEMDTKGYCLALGYRNLFDYAQRALRLSDAQAYYFSKVAQKSRQVPQLKEAVMTGELSISQARRIAPVLTQANAASWIEKAATLPQKVLELEIKKECPEQGVRERIRPIAEERLELRCGISLGLEKKLARIRDLVSQKKKSSASIEEALECMAEAFLEKTDPVRKAERSVLRKRKTDLPPAPVASIQRTTARRTAIPAAIQHAVSLRDNRKCCYQAPDGTRCEQTRWTEIHHVRPVALGGPHEIENLITLCSRHHSGVHRGGVSSSGKLPFSLKKSDGSNCAA